LIYFVVLPLFSSPSLCSEVDIFYEEIQEIFVRYNF
jgi:hypothetical protein